jgi:hypothetical protein
LISLAAITLGGEAVPFGATLFDKSSSANWLVAWHQDRALPLMERREAAGWGPWSQKDGVVYAVRRIQPIMCTVERGGVIVMRPLTVHASSKATTAASRRMLHLEYAAATFDEGPRLRVP